MVKEELICRIGKADPQELQDIMDAVINRYRQLNPDWEFLYFAYPKGKTLTSAEQELLRLAWEMGE